MILSDVKYIHQFQKHTGLLLAHLGIEHSSLQLPVPYTRVINHYAISGQVTPTKNFSIKFRVRTV